MGCAASVPAGAAPRASAVPAQAVALPLQLVGVPGARAANAIVSSAAAAVSAGPVAHPDGISLAGLRAFVAEHGGAAGLAGKTTSDVKWQIVVPDTKAAACSYANLLRARERGACVGRASAFVSHVYSYAFLDVVEAITAWEARRPAGEPPVFYYFDLLVVNQHGQSAAVAPEVLWREFTGGVRAIGRTLLVLTLDASERGPLTRAWCVAEMAAGLQGDSGSKGGGGATEGSFEVIMTPAEEARFIKELTHDFSNVVKRTCTVDLARCHAYHGDECLFDNVCRDVAAGRVAACSDDLRFVLDNVRRELPLEEASKRVIQRMKGSMEGMARAALAAIPDTDKRAGSLLQFYLARFISDCGRLAEAEALLRETAEVRRRTLGVEAKGTLVAIGQLASALQDQGKLDGAEKLYREALDAQRRTLGDTHPNTLTSIGNLGDLLKARGDLDGADRLCREELAALRRTLGNTNPSTLTSIGNLGGLLRDRGDLGGAELLLREALDAQRRTLGDAHPSTLTSINNLGGLLKYRGDLDGAEKLYREALEASRRTLGDTHASTLAPINNLGALMRARGDLAGAESLVREALDAQRRTLGDAHPDTLTSISNLGGLLRDRGDLNGAEELLREALAGRRRVLGVAHMGTRGIALWLAALLRAQGDEAGAAEVEATIA